MLGYLGPGLGFAASTVIIFVFLLIIISAFLLVGTPVIKIIKYLKRLFKK